MSWKAVNDGADDVGYTACNAWDAPQKAKRMTQTKTQILSSSLPNLAFAWSGSQTIALNRLTQVQQTAGGPPTTLASYTYDGDNLRIRKTTGGGDVTNYLYDGLQLLAETDGAGVVKKLYNPGISVTDDKGNKFYYLHDGRANVANLIDKDGNIVDAYTYDAFGKAVGVTKSNNEFLHDGLEGVMADMDVQLEYMWNRWYDPELGRFISRDPIGFSGGDLNLYAYAGNNPLTFTDPWGLSKQEVRSNEMLRLLVPGQVAWDNFLTEMYFGNDGAQAGSYLSQFVAEQALAIATLGAGNAASGLSRLLGPAGPVFGRGGRGLLNSNDFIRIGYGWSGSAQTGSQVFRIAIGSKRLPFHWHFP